MTVRLMMWNIKFFTNQNFTTISRTDSLSAAHLVDAVRVVNPDILVVIEVRSSDTGGVGNLISNTGGAAGVLQLQGLLGNNWYAVPPQVLNAAQAPLQVARTTYFEGIGVFFNNTNVDFIGPSVWTEDQNTQDQSPATRAAFDPMTQTLKAYDPPWNNALPNAQPANCQFMGATQRQLAGQSTFFEGTTQLMFPALWARNPYYTAFWDKNANRVIKLVSVHLPPTWTMARRAMVELGRVDVSGQIAAADTKGVAVICGDFNVNMMNPNQNDYFDEGNLNNYTALLPSNANRATLVRKAVARSKAPWLRTPTNWWKKDKDGYYVGIDNIMVNYYGVGGGAVAGFHVLDWVQIAKPNPSPPNPNAYMYTPLNNIISDGNFVNKFNFGKMRNTSDHLGLYADI